MTSQTVLTCQSAQYHPLSAGLRTPFREQLMKKSADLRDE
jgi:hypothetical protein